MRASTRHALCCLAGLHAAAALRAKDSPLARPTLLKPSKLSVSLARETEEADQSLGLDQQLLTLVTPGFLNNTTPAEDVDAWIRMSHCHQTLETNMYTPALVSLQDALQGIGATARIVDKSMDGVMVDGIRGAVAKGKLPLLIDVGTKFGRKTSKDIVQLCGEIGAYVVLYSTEAGDAELMSSYVTELGADEVWEYAMSNIDGYSQAFRERVPVRYMPPGYSPQLDVHVDYKPKKARQHSVAFMGGLGRRPQRIVDMYGAMLGRRLVVAEDVWTNTSLRLYLRQYPLQLNMHKNQTCCPHDPQAAAAMEAFRLAPLLTNQACVISTPVPEKDARLWEGIVHFAEVNETLLELKRLAADVPACQQSAARLFRERFLPEQLLRASGFLTAWQPRN